jgi:hypothetical protein
MPSLPVYRSLPNIYFFFGTNLNDHNRPEQARDYAKQMIGRQLITKQTGAAGRACNAVS